MSVIDLSYVTDLETRMRVISESTYDTLTSNLWWDKITKRMTSESRAELFIWLLTSAKLEDLGKGGNIFFEELATMSQRFEQGFAGAGLKVKRSEFEDLDGHGVDLAAKWSQDIAEQIAYWPQRRIASLVLAGESGVGAQGQQYGKAYDGQYFFSTTHPSDPGNPSSKVYSNILTSGGTYTNNAGGSSTYPSFAIDPSVTIDTAFVNLSAAIAFIQSVVGPDQSSPRNLNPVMLMGPPALRSRLWELTQSKFIAMASSGGGGGSSDIEGVIQGQGFAPPIIVPEMSALITGNAEDDKTYYIGVAETMASQLGMFVYIEREAFHINYYSGLGGNSSTGVDAILDRANQLEWHCTGRNTVGYGHPYMLFKVKG